MGGSREMRDGMMLETLVDWTLNGVSQAPLLCSGQDEEALLTGHLITFGLVDSAKDILSVARCENNWQVCAALSPEAKKSVPGRLDKMEINRSGRTVKAAELNRLCDELMALDHSAGLHSVLLCDGKKTVIGRDVGRHNALDKAVGKALKEGIALDQAVLCSSGRLSLEMFAKAAFAGIPILATRKQVGSLCAAYADRLDIAVCRVGKELQCFSAPWRVIQE